MSDRVDEVLKMAAAVWIMSHIKLDVPEGGGEQLEGGGMGASHRRSVGLREGSPPVCQRRFDCIIVFLYGDYIPGRYLSHTHTICESV